MRWLAVLALSSMGACTRTNPAYERTDTEDATVTATSAATSNGTNDSGSTATLDTTVSAEAGGPTTVDPDTTDTSAVDVPLEPSCEMEPMDGLTLVVGDPARFGGVCPTGFSIWMMVASANDGGIVIDTCAPGCKQCPSQGHPLSMLPLVAIDDHVPLRTCLVLEAVRHVGGTATRCHYGALTIYDPELDVPYVIATTRNTTPTVAAMSLLGDASPKPVTELECECSAVGIDDGCCAVEGPATFWTYAANGPEVAPGQSASIELPHGTSLEHTFWLYQAQDLNSCETPELELSWAALAQL